MCARNCSEQGYIVITFPSFLNCQVLRVYTLLCMCSLQCSYHYSIFDENWTPICRRFEQIHCFFGVMWIYSLVHVQFGWLFSQKNENMPLAFQTYVILLFFLSFLFPFCPCIPADALKSLRQSCNFVCPNDGFLEQVVYSIDISSWTQSWLLLSFLFVLLSLDWIIFLL